MADSAFVSDPYPASKFPRATSVAIGAGLPNRIEDAQEVTAQKLEDILRAKPSFRRASVRFPSAAFDRMPSG